MLKNLLSILVLRVNQSHKWTLIYTTIRPDLNYTQLYVSESPLWTLLPDSPAWDAHCLDNTDYNLGHEHEEKGHKIERAVSPANKRTSISIHIYKMITHYHIYISVLNVLPWLFLKPLELYCKTERNGNKFGHEH